MAKDKSTSNYVGNRTNHPKKSCGGVNAGWFKPQEITLTKEELARRAKVRYLKIRDEIIIKKWERQIKKLGCSPERYAELLQEQNGRCAICRGVNRGGRRLAVDHCHKSSEVRALLCTRCNVVIGLVEENTLLLDYLRDYICLHLL